MSRQQASPAFTMLPGGEAAVAGGLVVASLRGRMLEAMAQAVAIKGYASATVADVVAGAGVSRKTFYEHFTDKEDCFLAACEYVAGALYDTLARAIASAPTPDERLERLVRGYVRTLRASPRGAIAFVIEARAATPKIREHHRRILERFAELVQHPDAPGTDDQLFRLAAVMTVEDFAGNAVAERGAESLAELEDTLVQLAARIVGTAGRRPG
jgi:AcrR family transcriptional regulator